MVQRWPICSGIDEDNMREKWVRALSGAAIGLALAAVSAASAQAAESQASGRVAKMRETGAITLGYPETSVPFAFLDGNQKPVGYTVEICEHVVQEIRAALELPKLKTVYTPTTSATRIQLLGNGAIDLECGNTTNNVERHQLVSFAPTTFVAQVVLVARKDAGVDVNDPASFRGNSRQDDCGSGRRADFQGDLATQRQGQTRHHRRCRQGYGRDLPDDPVRPGRGNGQ
jgi:ABC-type amino acid transport substrate-binding protein